LLDQRRAGRDLEVDLSGGAPSCPAGTARDRASPPQRPTRRARDLARHPFIFLTQTGEPRVTLYFRRRCIEAGFDPDIVLEVEHTDALLAFVAEGLGVSCVPRWIERLGFRGIRTIPLRPAFHGGISAVWHPALLSPIGRRFLDALPTTRRASG
jgi:DNA-binding transcriptional LysR family regulator